MKDVPEVEDLLRRIKKPPFDDNVSQYCDEIEALHASRAEIPLKASRVTNPKMIEAFAEASAFRSRIVAIKVKNDRKRALLKALLQEVVNHVWTIRGQYLNDNFNTKPERDMVIRSILSPVYRKIAKYDMLSELADTVISDIDQTQWNLKGILTALELSSRREMKL